MSLSIPRQSGSSTLFCLIELWDPFKRRDFDGRVSENEMLRSLTFILQLGYGFMWECQGLVKQGAKRWWELVEHNQDKSEKGQQKNYSWKRTFD